MSERLKPPDPENECPFNPCVIECGPYIPISEAVEKANETGVPIYPDLYENGLYPVRALGYQNENPSQENGEEPTSASSPSPEPTHSKASPAWITSDGSPYSHQRVRHKKSRGPGRYSKSSDKS